MELETQSGESPAGGQGFFSREAVRGIPWMVISKLVLFFVYFGVSVLTVNGLGRDKYGVYSLMTNIASYMLVVCGLGLCTALMRYIPELAARRNRWAMGHLLWKSALLQIVAVVAVSAILIGFSRPLQDLFNAGHIAHFRFYLILACGLTALWLLKEFVGTVFTSLFCIRTVAILSVAQGVVWFGVLVVALRFHAEVETILLVQMSSVAAVFSIGAVLLFRYVRALPWTNREKGIGKRRALSFSGVVMLNSILRMVMFKYSEIFFIAAVGGTTMAGMYDLGYSLPYTAVTFIPLALMPLFTAAFAEAYVRDNSCLGRLITSYYKLLMMVSLPMAALGAWFAPEAYRIIYQGEMNQAGDLASAFCLVLCLPLYSIPLSAAIKAKEQMMDMVPTLLVQITVNLVLDWVLIVHLDLGVWGGIGAVLGTFLMTIPYRVVVVRRLIGGVYFPGRFFMRILFTLLAEGAVLHWLVRRIGLFELFEGELVNLLLLLLVGVVYMGIFLLLIRMHRIVRHEDVEDFHNLDIKRLNKVLHFLVRE
ncbi:MAG: oligosaccharide flippase family protein [Pontiellaceae bacterium]|nr:oligosaccharide flippase family protein [Pontiellaceae bacterium]MBN2785732.1 oligosaccharide flippase family protein [Pontiellaceae bacterium]